jgi:hypothetical protein
LRDRNTAAHARPHRPGSMKCYFRLDLLSILSDKHSGTKPWHATSASRGCPDPRRRIAAMEAKESHVAPITTIGPHMEDAVQNAFEETSPTGTSHLRTVALRALVFLGEQKWH